MTDFNFLWPDAEFWDDAAFWTDDIPSILPPQNTGIAEQEIEQVSAGRLIFYDYIRPLWSPEDCPADLLPWLAWALSVDEWDAAWTDADRRAVVAGSALVHRRKGTIGSIRRALRNAGYGDAEVIEGQQSQVYDGSILHSGQDYYAAPDHWAQYRVNMFRPITNRQAAVIRRILGATAPLRCELVALNFTAAPFEHNAAITYNGAANYGVS